MNSYSKSFKAISSSISTFINLPEVLKWKDKNLDASYKSLENCFQFFQTTKIRFLESAGYEVVQLSEKDLKLSYDNLRKSLTKIARDKAIVASISMVFSSTWQTFSNIPVFESPISVAVLSIGGGFILGRTLESQRIKKYVELSILSNPKGPAVLEELNHKIQRIVAGGNPNIRLTRRGLEVYGPLGNIALPSFKREEALSKIVSMKKVVIPFCVLGKDSAPIINSLIKRAISSVALPFSFFHLLTISSKNFKDRTWFNYGASFASVYNFYHYFSGESISEIRKKFSNFLDKGKKPEEILKLLIDGNDFHEGMSFLQFWVADAYKIGVAVDWKGDLILYKNEEISFFAKGLYPVQSFPREEVFDEKESNKEINSEEKLLYVLGVLTLFSAGVFFFNKKKNLSKNL